VLYDPRYERDACGIGFVADAAGRPSRDIVDLTIGSLCRVRHRGAVAADEKTGDGAGVLLPIPRRFFASVAEDLGVPGADPDWLGVAMVFLSPSSAARESEIRDIVEKSCRAETIDVVLWREVPVEPSALGHFAQQTMPRILQAILLRPAGPTLDEVERHCHRARKRSEALIDKNEIAAYFPSFSFRTVTYKGLVAADQLAEFYPDLTDARMECAFGIFHQRYSTNTAPTWERAQPFRLLCHNGEINTIQGNVNRMRAREGRLGKRDLLEEEVLRPIIDESGSDSAMFDNVIQLLSLEGENEGDARDIRHVVAMLMPAAWESAELDDAVRDFYRYHASLFEPWDGPAGLVFTDGVRVGAALDRNGLRPLRYAVCEDGLVACSSEAGAVNVRGRGLVRRGKLGPGRMICVDPANGGFEEDPVAIVAKRRPYGAWVAEYRMAGTEGDPTVEIPDDLKQRQIVHGYTREEMNLVLRPMAAQGKEPTFSMGDDTPAAVMSELSRPLYNYFKQRFAQVTNPAIDHLRERTVMSLRTLLGPHDPVLWERPEGAALLEFDTFLLFKTPGGARLDATFAVEDGTAGLRAACERIAHAAVEAARHGGGILVVTDDAVGPDRAPVPSLLAVGAVHQALLRAGHRTRTSIVVETDDARESHHFACLLGYGAEAIIPRLALAGVASLALSGRTRDVGSMEEALLRYRAAVEEGVLKILSKMGISTVDSYRGAQIFDALGIGSDVVELCFAGTPSPLGGLGFEDIAADVLARHAGAYSAENAQLANPGFVKFHRGGEYHATNPNLVRALHDTLDPSGEVLKSTQAGDDDEDAAEADQQDVTDDMRAAHALHKAVSENGTYALYERFARMVAERPSTAPRDLLEVAFDAATPVPLADVEPVAAITRRFSTGAISHGSIGREAHETLAIALNKVGGKSNTGEGGEDPYRFRTKGEALDKNSRIKQVASGRFGVTPEYLAFADELQIKIAQGSKPGEGGQLPGHKVTTEIARLRHTQPGVALISPPPHHDIYSIEDLAQLIFDLKQANPRAEVSVKLVAEAGVGTIAAGVIKGLADIVQIAGSDGGTGASPLSSIKNAGLPWEIGLAEAQQTLVLNGLRDRAKIRVDGGLKTGRDVLIAALLGADEFSFGTAALVAEGCIMVRSCHLDTCPTGIATQREDLRAKFAGTPDMVAEYLRYVAEDVRRMLAALGMRTLDEAIGRVDLLKRRAGGSGRSGSLVLEPLLDGFASGPRHFVAAQPIQQPRSELGDRVFAAAFPAIESGEQIEIRFAIGNPDRAVGARLGAEIGLRWGAGQPPGGARVFFDGEAGQSFGAFLNHGVEFVLHGEANDYVGKGMGGGRIVIIPPADDAGDPYLAGNTVLYGATGGELFIAGRAGERFGVRNSGATAVVEGVGDHGCEYMTGGTVVVLGPTGANYGAGMTGGESFIFDPGAGLPARVNPELVETRRCTDDELTRLRDLVVRHAELTGSPKARSLLGDWRLMAHTFWRIAPKDEVAKISAKNEGTLKGAKV
jgi:glutamate synthase (ferredoxin)